MRALVLISTALFVGCGSASDVDAGAGGGGANVGGGGGARTGGGGGSSCGAGLTLCMGQCRDTASDSSFCGGCFTACSTGSACAGGQCVVAAGGGGGTTGGGTGGGVATGGGSGGGVVTGGGSGGGVATGGGSGGGVVTGGGSGGGVATGGGSGGGVVTGGGSGGGVATGGGSGGGVVTGGGSGGGVVTGGGTGGGVATPLCGDGLISGTETCDDGNTNQTDGCVNCAVSLGYACNGAPSICSTTTFRINNGTSFPIVSVVIDGVERVPVRTSGGQCFGYASNTYAEFNVTPNQSHTWTAKNGGVTDDTSCNDLVHETWGPLSFTQPPGLYTQTITNRPLSAYLNSGYSYSCWHTGYAGNGLTRVVRLRINNDGSWRFVETNGEGGPTLRSYTGTSWPETSRTISGSFYFRLNASNGFWNARYDSVGGLYVDNGVIGSSELATIIYQRQTNGLNGPPTNCPP